MDFCLRVVCVWVIGLLVGASVVGLDFQVWCGLLGMLVDLIWLYPTLSCGFGAICYLPGLGFWRD